MKNIDPTYEKLLIASGVIILLMFFYMGFQRWKINRITADNQLQAVELASLKDSVTVHKSKSGELTYQINSIETDKRNLKKSLELMDIDRNMLKERDIEWRRLTNALRVELAAAGNGTTHVRDTFRIEKTDTIYFQKVDDWTNNYLSLYNAEIVNKKFSFNYTYKTGIDFLTTGKRNQTTVSVILTDPNAAITTARSITVDHKTKWFEKPWLWGAVGLGTGILISR